MLHFNNPFMPDLQDGHLSCKHIKRPDLHLKEWWQCLGHILLSLPHLRRRAWSKKHSPVPAKTFCQNIKGARCRQNSSEMIPQYTAIRNPAGKQRLRTCPGHSPAGDSSWAFAMLEFLFLSRSCPLGPALPAAHVRSTSLHQSSRNKQHTDTCKLHHSLHRRARVKNLEQQIHLR